VTVSPSFWLRDAVVVAVVAGINYRYHRFVSVKSLKISKMLEFYKHKHAYGICYFNTDSPDTFVFLDLSMKFGETIPFGWLNFAELFLNDKTINPK